MKKFPFLFAVAALLLTAGPVARGQSLYGTNFDGSTAYPYTDSTVYLTNAASGEDLVGQGNPVWTGNDDTSVMESSTVYHGGLNAVVASTIDSGDAGQLAGEFVGGGVTVYPGNANVFVAHPLTLTPTALTFGYILNTDFNVSTSANAFNSGYGFAFLNSSNANVLSIQFTQDTSHVNSRDFVGYTIGTGTAVQSSTVGIALNGTYHLALSVNVAANTFSLSLTSSGTTLPVFTNVSLGATLASSTTQVAATQFVSPTASNPTGTATTDGNGGITNTGNDTLTFDNFSIVVPEPSTYVMMGLGLFGSLGLMKLRRMA